MTFLNPTVEPNASLALVSLNKSVVSWIDQADELPEHLSLLFPFSLKVGARETAYSAITWRRHQLLRQLLRRVIQAAPLTYSFFRSLRFLGGVGNIMRRVEQSSVLDGCMCDHAKNHAVKYKEWRPTLGHVPSNCLALDIRTFLGFVVFLSLLQCLTQRTIFLIQNL